MIKNWIKEKIYGKYINQINQLENAYECMKAEKNVLAKECDQLEVYLNQERDKSQELRDVIDRIQAEIPQEDLSVLDEIRLKMHIINKPHIDFVFAMQPMISMDINEPIYKDLSSHRIRLETHIGFDLIKPEEISDTGDFAHRTYVNIARYIGEQVTDGLLRDTGWRTGI